MVPLVPIERPLGEPIEWTEARRPERGMLRGAHVLLRPIDAAGDAQPLYEVSHLPDGDPAIWTYLPDGPYESPEHLREALRWAQSTPDYVYFALLPLPEGPPLGVASYLRIAPEHGTIEIGHIWFAARLQLHHRGDRGDLPDGTPRAFEDLGFRRLEWKCNALNAASRRAAERFGFTFEGVFRQHQIVKGRNRDTAWYAITDADWPAIRAGFQTWLESANFDERGTQRRSLGESIAAARR